MPVRNVSLAYSSSILSSDILLKESLLSDSSLHFIISTLSDTLIRLLDSKARSRIWSLLHCCFI